jgi:hypothetical protein
LNQNCPLCSSSDSKLFSSQPLTRSYYHCRTCYLIFVSRDSILNYTEQKIRYDCHENNIENSGYIKFLNQAILPSIPFLAKNGVGLDYGSGPGSEELGSVLARLLEKSGYPMKCYDPIYQPILNESQTFDFIFSTEVWEHFVHPAHSIRDLVSRLKVSGILTVMTTAWHEKLDFSNWYYAKDDTHICFFHQRTMEWISVFYKLEIIAHPSNSVWIFRRMND